ncbi:T-cell-interacting, activating receptor on myeloid cells protein 1-like [Pteronotus mesoamericanus]|uniref:T-cell-interacting, activating receptor on myeloid cells protein 1-like n=1 Tax=Pteronotus mesoamericanus TaxID=1884717 RepID=UPI0023ECEBF9|nr:T-cell-interacting, activating receptor on myeloid cells protein 1-like [Pteronotus parnellii mesoamericanus]
MILPSLALLCVGLCVGQREWTIDESLPRPSISARPSSVVPAQNNVTLRCSAPARGVRFVFLKGKYSGDTLGFANSPKVQEELRLTDVSPSAAGEYTCQYYRRASPSRRSPPSDVLLLLVTGRSPKPSLQAHHGGNVTAGANVSLQCQQPSHATDFNMFALLKKGTPMPTQLRSQEGGETDFTLQSVTVGDTGNYSCVYYQAKAPFWASEPSDQLEIWVTESSGTIERGITVGNLIRLGLSAIMLVLMGAFLVEAWWGQKGNSKLGYLPKPTFLAQMRPEVASGENMTLQCQKKDHVIAFISALMRDGIPEHIDIQRLSGNMAQM